MTDRALLQQALEAMDRVMSHGSAVQEVKDILRERLAQPEQEPVAWRVQRNDGQYELYFFKTAAERAAECYIKRPQVEPLYPPPPPPQRKPLTDEEKDAARWRFLVDNSFDKEGVTQFHVWEHSWEPHSQTGEPTEWKQRVRGPALDRFIDRAIEAAHNIKGEA